MPQRNWIFVSILFVALSGYDKDLICLSLRRTHFLFVALSHCDQQNMYMLGENAKLCQKLRKFIQKVTKKCQKGTKSAKTC